MMKVSPVPPICYQIVGLDMRMQHRRQSRSLAFSLPTFSQPARRWQKLRIFSHSFAIMELGWSRLDLLVMTHQGPSSLALLGVLVIPV
ncbi:hypothetical protein NL676_003877 [Syzygium grande]|nr:hypothetical protein NL676_003877 [Syzygium grande]